MKSLSDYMPYDVLYVDAMNFLSRSYYAMSSLEYKGHKTGMLFGAARLVLNWKAQNRDVKIVFIWDGRNSWRVKKYPTYKANRRERKKDDTYQEFLHALDMVKDNLPIMGIDQAIADTYEADDTVWTVYPTYKGKRLFVTTDWDWWPLVRFGDILYTTEPLSELDLQKKFSKKYNCDAIPAFRMDIFKMLTGDTSDNISGLPRFPRKLAAEIANNTSVSIDDVDLWLRKNGHSGWSQKFQISKWIIEKNKELVPAKPPGISEVTLEEGNFDNAEFSKMLLQYGMGHLYDMLERMKWT